MLLERLAHHLGGQADLHVLKALNLFILVADQLIARTLGLSKLELMCRLCLFLARIAHCQLTRQFRTCLVALSLRRGDCLRQVHFCHQLLLAQLGTQTLSLLLRLYLCGGKLLLYRRAVVSKCTFGLAASGIEITLRLCRGSGKRHLLSLVRCGKPGLQLGNLGITCS